MYIINDFIDLNNKKLVDFEIKNKISKGIDKLSNIKKNKNFMDIIFLGIFGHIFINMIAMNSYIKIADKIDYIINGLGLIIILIYLVYIAIYNFSQDNINKEKRKLLYKKYEKIFNIKTKNELFNLLLILKKMNISPKFYIVNKDCNFGLFMPIVLNLPKDEPYLIIRLSYNTSIKAIKLNSSLQNMFHIENINSSFSEITLKDNVIEIEKEKKPSLFYSDIIPMLVFVTIAIYNALFIVAK